jgi:hypothetical protein
LAAAPLFSEVRAHLSQRKRPGTAAVIVKQKRLSRVWREASYRGLKVNRSTRYDLLRILGKAKWSGRPAGQTKHDPNPEVWYEYENVGEFPGKFTVAVDQRTGRILVMHLSPKKLSREQAVRVFGDDYIVTRYDFCENFEGDGAPVYESPQGSRIVIEYRSRGVALGVDEMNGVTQITYVGGPIGLASLRACYEELQKDKKISNNRD